MIRHPSQYWKAQAQSSYTILPKEADRWLALLAEPHNTVLQETPLCCGHLSIEGLFEASKGKKTKKAFMLKMQVMSPLERALLFIRCGADEVDLPMIFLRYSKEVLDAPEISGSTLQCYRLALEISGKQPSADDLLAVFPKFPTGMGSYGDISSILKQSESFATTTADATKIVQKWGVDKTGCTAGGAGRITCMSMVAHFPGANNDVVAGLCLAEDDFEALAFMVKQGRYTKAAWLDAVAACVGTQSSRYTTNHNRNIATANIERSSEQARAWQLIHVGQTDNDLPESCKQYAVDNPEKARDILRQAPDPCIEFDSWVLWTLGWVANGLASVEDPIVQSQILNAEKALDQYMSQPEVFFDRNPKLAWVHNLSELPLSWFATTAPRLADASKSLKDLLATRLLLRWTDETDKIQGMGQPKKPEVQHELDKMVWLDGANVERALRLRLQYLPSKDVAGAVPLPLLLQYRVRAPELWPTALAQLALTCSRGEMGVREILDAWLMSGPGQSYSPVPARLTRGDKLIYTITGLDTTPAIDIAKSLGLDTTSGGYQTVLKGWLEQNLACGNPSMPVALPELNIVGAGTL